VEVPAKADGNAQKNWIAWYQKFSKSLQPNEKIRARRKFEDRAQ
jgi:hypothetical protein